MQINAIGTNSASQPLGSMAITRREPGPDDVQIAIDYCGVCHSDVHQARSEWAGTLYPCVPGHEIVGRVTASQIASASAASVFPRFTYGLT